MKILVDILHPAHINFFRNFIDEATKEGHDVFITAINRGAILNIINKELHYINTKTIGKHNGNFLSIVFHANIFRLISLLFYLIKERFDIAFSVGSFNVGFIFKYILHKPNYQFDDDPERNLNVCLEKLTSTNLFFPPIIKEDKKIHTFNSLKEWAYLSPKYFKANQKALQQYGLKPKEYIFVREVSTGTLNYRGQPANVINTFDGKLFGDYKVLFSLEDKNKKDEYPDNWILLQEPIKDIHSLLYYSKLVVSSGDSMAREGAMLGIPAIYCGFREMKANELLINKNMLFKVESKAVPKFVNKILINNIKVIEQEKFRKSLMNEWVDVNDLLMNLVKENK